MKIQKLFEEEDRKPVLKKRIIQSESFQNLKPGTSDWMNFWKQHPDQQKEMIAFMQLLKNNTPTLKKRKEI